MADICLDPGHGGLDPGGGSNSSFKEKDMVLAISFEQKRHFERNGLKVYMTRTTDEYLQSVPRGKRVRDSGAKYCISNHINAFNGVAKGAETIHSIFSNKTIAEGALRSVTNLGAHYRRVFSKGNSGNTADWYFMHRLTGSVNTIIIEYGFADNKEDTAKIIKDWKKYAEAVAKYYIENVFKRKYIPEKSTIIKPKPPVANPTKPSEMYRVRRTWKDVASQKGAYTVLRFAEATADLHGLKVYNKAGKVVYTPKVVTPKPKPEPKPKPVAKKDYVHLPRSAKSWGTYTTNVKPVAKNISWYLSPSKFGGLTYEILGRPYANVVTIKTSKGNRNIYVHPSTGATFSKK